MDMTETVAEAPSKAFALSTLLTRPDVERELSMNTNRPYMHTNPTYMGGVDPLAGFSAPLGNVHLAVAQRHTDVSAERRRPTSEHAHPRA